MHRIKQIAIVFTDTLRGIGLQSLLTDYFPPVEVSHFPTLEQLSMAGNELYDYYFTDPETFVMNPDFFLPRRNKTAILSDLKREYLGTKWFRGCKSDYDRRLARTDSGATAILIR